MKSLTFDSDQEKSRVSAKYVGNIAGEKAVLGNGDGAKSKGVIQGAILCGKNDVLPCFIWETDWP